MNVIYTDHVLRRLEQLVVEIQRADLVAYTDRLRAFEQFCSTTAPLAHSLAQLPSAKYDFDVDRRDLAAQWPDGEAGYGYRWDAIRQIVAAGPEGFRLFWGQTCTTQAAPAMGQFNDMFVIPLFNYLVHQLETSSAILYLLLRYKRWVEWFQASRLCSVYREANGGGEPALDRDVRRFLFESGVDYPFSQPRSPRGQADVVAGLETQDPLVLEIKVWDKSKGYGEDRVRDGLRQVMDYAAKYGKSRGYVLVFNFDEVPLVFAGDRQAPQWPPRIERAGATYYFLSVDAAQPSEPVSQRDKGRRVEVNEIQLPKLWSEVG
jgi:hypothetical protein